jgi:hypothetical protein
MVQFYKNGAVLYKSQNFLNLRENCWSNQGLRFFTTPLASIIVASGCSTISSIAAYELRDDRLCRKSLSLCDARAYIKIAEKLNLDFSYVPIRDPCRFHFLRFNVVSCL